MTRDLDVVLSLAPRDVTALEEALRQENKNERAAEIRIENLRDFVSSIGSYERRTRADDAA